ncbi:MAG: hypothetical protein IPP73_12100 [Chitinophagaceae bacterium]|nr:hypothetical protein [Chitinophagaceae bacterium]
MPKFVLAPGATPLDHLTDKQISDLISQLTGPNEKLNQKVFSFDEKWAIYNQLVALGDDTGWPVTHQPGLHFLPCYLPTDLVQDFVQMKKPAQMLLLILIV